MPRGQQIEAPKKPKFDIYTLYEKSVMSPDSDVDFMARVFKKKYGRPARLFREDFCQTALIACEWAKRHPENKAWAVDLDPKPLSWAEQYNLPMIGKAAERVYLCEEDVLTAKNPATGYNLRFKFFVFLFKTARAAFTLFQIDL